MTASKGCKIQANGGESGINRSNLVRFRHKMETMLESERALTFLNWRQCAQVPGIVATATVMIRLISPILAEKIMHKSATHGSPDFASIALNHIPCFDKSAHAGHRNHHLRVTL